MSHVVIVGAGPAGASLAYLLVSRGIRVTLVERARDFAREFRGEILMPSGVHAIQEMGLGTLLTQIPHHTLQALQLYMNGRRVLDETLPAELVGGRLPVAVSQPALLEGLVSACAANAGFEFRRGAGVRALLEQDGRVTGVVLRGDDGETNLAADLVIGADGRQSAVRRHLQRPAIEMNPPMDIVWCKLPCPADWPGIRAYAGRGHLLIAYHTWDKSLQIGWVILKGTFRALRSQGVQAWVTEMANHVSRDFAAHLRAHSRNTQRPFLLESVSDRVDRWSAPGALLIGDAAHTMSPVGGQGVNVALRDAIVAANHLVPALHNGVDARVVDAALAAVQAERLPEIELIQNLQAQPPRLMLARAWWGEPLRHLAASLLSIRRVRARAAARLAVLPLGVTEVSLQV